MKLNKPIAGYHMLMILSAVDGKIFKPGGKVDYMPLMSLKGMTNSCYRLTENLYNQIGIDLLKPVKN